MISINNLWLSIIVTVPKLHQHPTVLRKPGRPFVMTLVGQNLLRGLVEWKCRLSG